MALGTLLVLIVTSQYLLHLNESGFIHQLLRVTLESNDVADNGKEVDYDFMLEAM